MEENIVAKLTAKDDRYACALTDKIISESQETDEWYDYFDDFASLLDHPKSLVRNRASGNADTFSNIVDRRRAVMRLII